MFFVMRRMFTLLLGMVWPRTVGSDLLLVYETDR